MNDLSTKSRPPRAAVRPRPIVPAIYKAFAILDLVSKGKGIGYSAIRNGLGLPKSSAHQLIEALCDVGALQPGPHGGYVLGLTLCELGTLARGQRSIEAVAMPLLKRLARDIEMTCHLGVLEGNDAIYLAKVDSEQDIQVATWVGKRLSLYRSSLGKVLLAWQPEAEREKLMSDIEWIRKTPKSLPDAESVRRHLAEVRAHGWAFDDEEDLPNIRCVAAPVFDHHGNVVAAISAVATVLQLSPEDFPSVARKVVAVCREVSRALGTD